MQKIARKKLTSVGLVEKQLRNRPPALGRSCQHTVGLAARIGNSVKNLQTVGKNFPLGCAFCIA
jgi:hypothetical protein